MNRPRRQRRAAHNDSRKRKEQTDLLARKDKINRLAWKARLAIKIVAGILALFFTWIKFSGLSFLPVLENTEPQVLAKVIVVFYYLCWVFGTGFDVGTQQAVYVSDPQEGQITLDTVGVLIGLTIVTAVLLWASDDIKVFCVILVVFVIVNVLLWRYLLIRVGPIIEESARVYRKDNNYPDLERLEVVKQYLAGNWQKHRFLAMCLILAVANLVCFFEPAQQGLIAVARLTLPPNMVPAVARLLPHLSIVLFIVVAEGWIWVMRVRTWASLHVIGELRHKYEIKPRTASASL
jgi:hypothetical protein